MVLRMSNSAVALASPQPSSPLVPSTSRPHSTGKKRPTTSLSSAILAKRPTSSAPNHASDTEANKLPPCLKKLVRSIVRTFYSREHSLIVDMLVRNTIMNEDDLCERLRFEKKQLRQYLHTLKTDQFIKSKIQLETDADGKTTKIIHYFIEYQLFVNVVKYRLDQMQRRLEAEQRQSSSRATFRCAVCQITYTDLEVDRLLSLNNPGTLECVYCRSEVTEQEDQNSRTDGRALIANFHRQVRDPIDSMLRECDEIHLSSTLLEPEIRPLEPLHEESESTTAMPSMPSSKDFDWDSGRSLGTEATTRSSTEARVRIVLSGQPGPNAVAQPVKQRPIWMADSTVRPGSGLGELDRDHIQQPQTISSADSTGSPSLGDSMTHTLTPGRIPSAFPTTKDVTDGHNTSVNSSAPSTSGAGGDIMQLLLVHERRGVSASAHLTTKASQGPARNVAAKPAITPSPTRPANTQEPSENEKSDKSKFCVKVGDRLIPYAEVTAATIKTMTSEEKAEYVRIGKLVYQNVMLV